MIKPLNKYDTRAVIKITDWLEQETLDKLKQNSTVDGEYFIREVLIGSELCKLIEDLQDNGKIKYEVIKTFHYPSEKLRQVMNEEEKTSNITDLGIMFSKLNGLKHSLRLYPELTLESYDMLYGDIEELQHLVWEASDE